MASPEAIKGSATQQSPPGSSVKSRSSKDDPMSHKTSKTTRKKGMPMKAPDEEEEEPAPLPQLTASLAHQFGIQELGRLLPEDPVLIALDARTSSRLHGSISIPQIDEVYTTLEANGLSSQSQYQYCGKGVSVARKYYHATKRSDETPLEYLHRLTVAGIRAKLRVKDDNATERREHVEHFIDTLGSHEQARADQLIMLSIEDGEALERILRARQQSRDHQGKVVYNPSKFRAKTPAPTPAKAVNSLRAQGEQNHDDYAVVSQVEEERREEPSRVSAVTPSNRGDEKSTEPHQRPPCSHCGLTLHKSEDCWTSLTCSHCNGRHPSDRCLKLCKACGEMHEAGACRFEEFFNVMRQWYVPQRHAGMLPPDAEKMLN
ncbi:hypothetical protein PR001_g13261 [Phytophthora rubi]|uniref:Uncharacterized protein n=1 Tax=Phytophthora rubi TaxID=129364 RepID=A0A6A3LUN5_9STRA|nr:hypothetical protein PR001_g13261 [Phytophthora rubi]